MILNHIHHVNMYNSCQLAVGLDINLSVTAIASECINLIDVVYQPKFPIIRAYISFIYLFVRCFFFFHDTGAV